MDEEAPMTLQILWFVLWGLLWAMYFTLDGFDFGVGMLRNFLTGNETGRRITHSAIGPVWNGNEVWLITAGGATFAAFPLTYATMFSFLYLPMLLILFSLIVRGVAIEFRPKHDTARWRSAWDWALAVSSFTAPLVLALGFGNIFQGLLFDSTGYHGSFLKLFNPFGLLTALLFLSLFLHHGARWLAYRTDGEIHERSLRAAGVLWFVVLGAVAAFVVDAGFATRLYDNYLAHPVLVIVPVLAVAAIVLTRVFSGRALAAFLYSGAGILLLMATALAGLFPNLIPSALDQGQNLTIYNSSSSHYTLRLMTIVALVFVPLIVLYQFLVYRFFRKKVGKADLEEGY
jgi:cytochrome d ubiquinol oxidase subunit II